MLLNASPDVIICRSSRKVEDATKSKISVFCHVPASHVISVHDVSNIYYVPLILTEQGIHGIIKDRLHLKSMSASPDLYTWEKMAKQVDDLTNAVKIAIVGTASNFFFRLLGIVASYIRS